MSCYSRVNINLYYWKYMYINEIYSDINKSKALIELFYINYLSKLTS